MKLKIGHRYLIREPFPCEDDFFEIRVVDESKDTYKIQYASGSYDWVLKRELEGQEVKQDFGKTRFKK